MAVSRVKTWIAGEVLSASDLNAEFSNILNNGESLGWPATVLKDLDGQQLVLDVDADSHFTADTDDRLDLALAGTDLFRWDGTATTPVNGLDFIARATGSPASIQAQGSDANVAFDLRDDNGNELLIFSAVASAVNEFTMVNAATGNAPVIRATGESNIGFQLQDSNSNEVVIGASVASAVNEITVSNAATGNNPQVAATGETNVSIEVRSRGTGDVILADDAGNQILIADDVASAINEITVRNAAIGTNPSLRATGDDTDIGIDLVPAGTGAVLLPNGAVATPAAAASADINTGIYFPAADAIGVVTGGTERIRIDSITPIVARNTIINGGFRVAQRGTTFDATTTPVNNDDTYLLDRWVLLSDGNDAVDVTQETTTVPTGAYAAIRLDVETGNVKFGLLQILETRDAAALIGGTASLSFKARRTGTSIDHLRAGVLAWDSTADTVTSDVASAWGAAGTNPTLVANWTFENTPVNLATLTTAFQTFRIENISIDTASTTNVAVFIWIDDVTTTVGDFLYIADVQLELGPVATAFETRLFSDELARAQRYFEVWLEDSGNNMIANGVAVSTTTASFGHIYGVQKRVVPSITFSAQEHFRTFEAGVGNAATTAISATAISTKACQLDTTTAATGLAASEATNLSTNNATAAIRIDAEL